MMVMTTVTARQLTLTYNGTTLTCGEEDENGIFWAANEIDLGGELTTYVTDKAGDHGGWVNNATLKPRVIDVKVTAVAGTARLRQLAGQTLRSVVPLRGTALLVVTEDTPIQTYIRRSGKINETRTASTVEFTFGMVAEDPRLYSTTLKSTTLLGTTALAGIVFPVTFPITFPSNGLIGAGVVTNDGYFNTPATIEIFGPRDAPGIENIETGEIVQFSTLSLGATDVLTLDFSTRRAMLNGVYRPADATSQWFYLDAGQTTIRLTGNGSGTGTITWRDAFEG